MKIILATVAILITGLASAQIGISAGGSILKAFGKPRPYAGFHLSVEVPRDDATSVYGRLTQHLKQVNEQPTLVPLIAKELTTIPYSLSIDGYGSMNYTILEGGTRYYLGNGYDFGWSAYGGTNFMVVFNTVKMNLDGYDQVLYEPVGYDQRKGSIISFGGGLGGGVKYTIPSTGTFYFDTGVTYILTGFSSNQLASDQANLSFSQLFFNFNLGFRKDLFW